MASSNGAVRYAVQYPPAVSDQLQRWADRATGVGFLGDYAALLLDMQEQLTYRPEAWADSIRTAVGSADMICLRYTPLFNVEYEILRVERTVRVTRVFLPPGSPLADPGPAP